MGRIATTETTTTVLHLLGLLLATAALGDVGLERFPDARKINVSQDEYSRMMNVYLDRRRTETDNEEVNELLVFKAERKSWRRSRDGRIYFPVDPDERLSAESAELKVLAPAFAGPEGAAVRVRAHQILGTRRRRFAGEGVLYASAAAPKWFEVDVTAAARSWLAGGRNLGLELECVGCARGLRPAEAFLNVLAAAEDPRRKRSAAEERRAMRTDCRGNDSKKRCCRHKLKVSFKDLNIVEMNSIVQPKTYEAGYCRGRCPVNYNHATNHSRIQSIIRKVNKTVPKVCCAPSKLEPVEILRVDPFDATKLYFEKWDNMKVLECACS